MMYRRRSSGRRFPSRRGAVLILVLLCIPVMLIFAAFAVNVSYMQLTRTELRTATDASARAGSRTLSLTQDAAAARSAAVEAAARNNVAGTSLNLAAADIQFGDASSGSDGTWSFSPQSDSSPFLNAVRVNAARAGANAVPLIFDGVFSRRDFEPAMTATAAQIDRDVILVLDRSGSMNAATPTGKRWTDLETAVAAFLAVLQRTPQIEHVGLVTYSSNATEDHDLTGSYPDVLDSISRIKPQGRTAIGEGLEKAERLFEESRQVRQNARKTILLMTDGMHNQGVDPERAADEILSRMGMTIHTITFSKGADKGRMKKVAETGKGRHWHADDQGSLVQVFIEIANNLPTLTID